MLFIYLNSADINLFSDYLKSSFQIGYKVVTVNWYSTLCMCAFVSYGFMNSWDKISVLESDML